MSITAESQTQDWEVIEIFTTIYGLMMKWSIYSGTMETQLSTTVHCKFNLIVSFARLVRMSELITYVSSVC